MASTPNDIIDLLVSEDSVAQACERVEGWAKAGRAGDLVRLARELEARGRDPERRPWFEAVADHVEDQLAESADPAGVDALLALSLEPRERSTVVPRGAETRVRALASRLGFGQTVDAFLAALERAGEKPEHRELFACWMHEVVLRGTSLANDPRAKRFREALASVGHPLAGLPLALRPTEREAPTYMPLYGEKALGRAIETLTSGPLSARTIPPPADGASVRATRADDPALAFRLGAAVRPWAEGKSGKVESKIFSLAPSVRAANLGSWLLRALPLESTTAAARLDCLRVGAEGVFGPLFAAGSNGGAYSAGLGGAYGRRAAWTSLGALVGAQAEDDVDTIEALAAKTAFLTFRAPGPWFYDVAWDLGALALRQDGATVAVLAATDTE